MAKTGIELRDGKCAINPRGTHRWAQSFKDKISKTQFVQVLRCRYCANFLMVVFERMVLPSGRVVMDERIELIQDAGRITPELRQAPGVQVAMKHIENKMGSAERI